MYCKHCGKEIDDMAAICVHCGVPTDNYPYRRQQPPFKEIQPVNILAIIGFALSFFMAVAGLICSIIGYKEAPRYNGSGRTFALAGIIISAVEIALTVLVVLFVLISLIFIDNAVFVY